MNPFFNYLYTTFKKTNKYNNILYLLTPRMRYPSCLWVSHPLVTLWHLCNCQTLTRLNQVRIIQLLIFRVIFNLLMLFFCCQLRFIIFIFIKLWSTRLTRYNKLNNIRHNISIVHIIIIKHRVSYIFTCLILTNICM